MSSAEPQDIVYYGGALLAFTQRPGKSSAAPQENVYYGGAAEASRELIIGQGFESVSPTGELRTSHAEWQRRCTFLRLRHRILAN